MADQEQSGFETTDQAQKSAEAAENGQDARSNRNNTQNVRNAADIAIASKEPHAVAAGKAIKGADAVTGGKASELMGKSITKMNKILPDGDKFQEKLNQMNESGSGDAIGKAASMKDGFGGAGAAGGGMNGMPDGQTPNMNNNLNNNQLNGGEQNGSPSSDGDKKDKDNADTENDGKRKSSKNSEKTEFDDNNSESDEEEAKDSSKKTAKVLLKSPIAIILILLALIIIPFLFIIMTIQQVIAQQTRYQEALAISDVTGGPDGNTTYGITNNEFNEFIERVVKVAGDSGDSESYENPTDSPYLIIVATVHIIQGKDNSYRYQYFTKSKLKKIKNQIKSDETKTKANLANNIFPKYIPNLSQGEYERMADDVFKYIRDYYSYVGHTKDEEDCTDSSSDTCSYGIKGFYVKGRGNKKEKLNLTNVKVRIMDCDNRSKPVSGEELVDFEKYILGVAYAEDEGAREEAFKAQLIAARSYILARHVDIGGSIKKEGNYYIVETVSCTKDQVYCDPDRGCSRNGSNMRSGTAYTLYKKALPSNHKYRKWAKEVEGKLVLNKDGYVVYTDYTQSTQDKFEALAKANHDYKAILLDVYGKDSNATDVSSSSCSKSSTCTSTGTAASGAYTEWKQTDSAWGSVPLGNSSTNIHNSGCTITSIAMQIKRSGVNTSKVAGDFNPGTFVQALNKINGFTDGGGIIWSKVTEVVPDFKFVTVYDVRGKTKEEKLSRLKELVGKGYYVVAEVKGATQNSQHWVAVNQVTGNTITMMDPATSATDMWKKYDYNKTTYYACYKVS